MFKRFELDVTLKCSLKCNNCDRSCGVAPCNLELTLDQIKIFIDEANKTNINWDFIALLGGEPTLHPHILDIIEMLHNGLKYNTEIVLKTNGYTEKTKELLTQVPPYVRIENSAKLNSTPLFSTYNYAPIDTEMFKDADFTKGCPIAEGCGPSLYPPGKYFCCGAGATVDRIFNLNIGVDTINELTEEKINEQKKILCSYCGHFKDWGQPTKYTTEQITSESWSIALGKYNK